MRERRKVAAVHTTFKEDIDALLRLDALNQQRYRAGPGRPGPASLSKGQMTLITEGIFVRAFTYYELFLEESFLLYVRGRATRGGKKAKSYIAPKNTIHAREILQGQMKFLEWNSADTTIKRSETFLVDGWPIKQAITSNLARLRSMRKIRNAIAHRSPEALGDYTNVVTTELRARPLDLPAPGEFLLLSDPSSPPSYFLVSYLEVLKTVADVATA